jgi:hypothetical protein
VAQQPESLSHLTKTAPPLGQWGDDAFFSKFRRCQRFRPATRVTVEILANLVYLFRQTDTHSEKQRYYLDWAAKVMRVEHHPKLRGLGRVPVTNPQ